MITTGQRSWRNRVILASCVCLLPVAAFAQQYSDPLLRQDAIQRKPADFRSTGIRIGSFTLAPAADLSWESNDNIFYSKTDKVSDNVMHLRPRASLMSGWSRHELNINAIADIVRHSTFDNENTDNWAVHLDGRVDVKRRSALSYNAGYARLHEDRSSPDDVGGIKPTGFDYTEFGVGYSHTFNRLTADLGYDNKNHNYANNRDSGGNILDNQDRDRSHQDLSLRLSYARSSKSSVFVSAASNSVNYDQRLTNDGEQRSSDGYNLNGGVSFDITGLITGDLYLAYSSQSYDDAGFKDVNGFGIGAALDWQPTKLTDVSFNFSNTPQETTQAGTSGYFSSVYSVRAQHELRRNLLVNVNYSFADNDYQLNGNPSNNSMKNTQVARAGLGLNYMINKNLSLSGGYSYQKQSANSSLFEYQSNRWFLVFGAEL